MSGGTPAQLIWGPMLIGTFLNVLLYGVSVTQMYMYYSGYKKDKPWMKALIIFLFIADTVNTAFDMQMCYASLVNHFGDQDYILTATWVFAADPTMTGIIGMTVQLFFSWRIKVLTGSIWLALLVGCFSVTQFLAGLGTSIAVGIIPQFLEFRVFKPAVVVWLAGSTVCDSLITIILVSYLRRNKTGFVVTDGVLDKIIRLTVQTGAITSVVAIIDLVLFLANPAGLHLAFNLPLAKLYTNSLLSSLNARGGWAYNTSSRPDPHTHSVSLQQRRRDMVNFESSNVRPEVYVNVESHEMTDPTRKHGRSEFMDPESLDSKEDSLAIGRPAAV